MSLRFLTFNIWFSPHEMAKRMEAIAGIIAARQPQVVALQEMTDIHWAECMKHQAFRVYHWSPPPQNGGYYTMLGCLEGFVAPPERFPFEVTMMERDLLVAEIRVAGLPPFLFGTSHMESLNSFKARREQMGESFNRLAQLGMACPTQRVEDMIFCGDTNINEQVDGVVKPPRPWQDAWFALRQGDPGYTFDVARNGMMARMDGWARDNRAQLRFDRFWTRLKNFQLEDIELVGVEALAGDRDPGPIWPSDHFGVLLTVKASKQSAATGCIAA